MLRSIKIALPAELGDTDLPREVEAELQRSYPHLRFSPSLESLFEQSTASNRAHKTQLALIIFGALEIPCLLCDLQVSPRVFHTALWLRLGLAVPAYLLGIWLLGKKIPVFVQGLALAFPTLIVTWAVLVLSRLSKPPFSTRYLMSILLLMAIQTMVVRARFRHAAAILVGMLLLFLTMTLAPGARTESISPDAPIFVIFFAIASLLGRFVEEREFRRNFLLLAANELHLREITRLNLHLEQLSNLDGLTGVFNRRYFDTALTRLWEQAQQKGRWLGLLMIDIDHFKACNDVLGHQHGDRCLEQVAQTLRASIRMGIDTVARYGGEEFAAILPDADGRKSAEIAERIRSDVQALAISGGHSRTITVSIGVAATFRPQASLTLKKLLRAADEALYKAKAHGRNRVEAWEPGEIAPDEKSASDEAGSDGTRDLPPED